MTPHHKRDHTVTIRTSLEHVAGWGWGHSPRHFPEALIIRKNWGIGAMNPMGPWNARQKSQFFGFCLVCFFGKDSAIKYEMYGPRWRFSFWFLGWSMEMCMEIWIWRLSLSIEQKKYWYQESQQEKEGNFWLHSHQLHYLTLRWTRNRLVWSP